MRILTWRVALAICGASRIQLGFSTEEAARVEPAIRTLQLAVDAVEAMTSKIEGRGGRVVIFHDLVTGEYGRVYREAYPRATYWDRAASRSSAIFIHADDEPEIARLVCPDGSHLNRSDMPAFTRALLAALRRRGALP